MTRSSTSAAVLIGGHSRRMGKPKGLLRLATGEPTFVERTVGVLRNVSDDVFLVGAADWLLPAPLSSCPVAFDEGSSAADGLVTALDGASHRFCIVVACDMPFLDASLLREMSKQALQTGRGVVPIDARGEHPLHAVWDGDAAAVLHEAIGRGERSLAALARLAEMTPFNLDGRDRTGRDRWSVFNVNTPDDLAVARARAARIR